MKDPGKECSETSRRLAVQLEIHVLLINMWDCCLTRYTSAWQALTSTFAREGLQGLYKGLVPNLFRVMPQSALTFMIYENTIRILKFL